MASQGRITLENNSTTLIGDLNNKIRDALRDSGLYIEGQAKLLSPVDTGNLRGSISHMLASNREVQIGTDVEYAIYVEKGTQHQSAQPYLTPAIEGNVNEIKNIFMRHLRQVGGNI